MSTQEGLVTRSYLAVGDLSTKQYFIMQQSSTTDKTVAIADGDDDALIGILQNKPSAAGRMATMAIGGVCKVVRAATVTITAGTWLTADSAGRAVPLLHSDGDLVTVLGRCVATHGATGVDELIEVEVNICRMYAGAAQS